MGEDSRGFDLKKLSEDLGVEVGELGPLFEEYVNEMVSELKDVQAYAKDEAWEKLQRTVHNIKGVSINLGLFDMHRQAEVLDIRLKANETGGIAAEADKLLDTFQDTKVLIRNEFGRFNIEFQ